LIGGNAAGEQVTFSILRELRGLFSVLVFGEGGVDSAFGQVVCAKSTNLR